MTPIPGQLIEFPRREAPETEEQKALRELKQREAQEFSAAQEESAPGSNMKPTADILPFPTLTAAELLDKKPEPPAKEMSEEAMVFEEKLINAKTPADAVAILQALIGSKLAANEMEELKARAISRFQKTG